MKKLSSAQSLIALDALAHGFKVHSDKDGHLHASKKETNGSTFKFSVTPFDYSWKDGAPEPRVIIWSGKSVYCDFKASEFMLKSPSEI